jgi:pilus assembly protein CpaB
MNFRALAIAFMVAALSGTLMVLYLRKLEVETSGGLPVRIVMAVKPLESGTVLTDDMLTSRAVPQAYVESRAIRESDRHRILGLKVETAIKPQQTVLWTDLAVTTDDRRNLSDLIQPGMRAVGIRASAEDQSFALVRPGDRVDIFANIPQPKDEQQRVAVLLSQNMLVLAVGLDMGGETIGTTRAAGERRDSVLTVSASVTQIQQLSLATERGKLSVVVKPRRETNVFEGVSELPYPSLLTPEKARVHAGPAKPTTPTNLSTGGGGVL